MMIPEDVRMFLEAVSKAHPDSIEGWANELLEKYAQPQAPEPEHEGWAALDDMMAQYYQRSAHDPEFDRETHDKVLALVNRLGAMTQPQAPQGIPNEVRDTLKIALTIYEAHVDEGARMKKNRKLAERGGIAAAHKWLDAQQLPVQEQVIADVGAMLGMCATLGNGKTIGEVRGKPKPKSALGVEVQSIVDRAIADAKAKREAKRNNPEPASHQASLEATND